MIFVFRCVELAEDRSQLSRCQREKL